MRRRNSIPEPLRSELRRLMVKAREEQDRQREDREDERIARLIKTLPDELRIAAGGGLNRLIIHRCEYAEKPIFGMAWTLTGFSRKIWKALKEAGYRPHLDREWPLYNIELRW